MENRIVYLYNEEIHEIGVAVGEEEKEERFLSKRSGWIEISRGEYYRTHFAIRRAIEKFKSKILDYRE